MRAPPHISPRRVVVTGLGLVTPLGVGLPHVWSRLLAGGVGVVRLLEPRFSRLPSRVASVVPRGLGVGEFDADAFVDRAQARSASVDFVAFALGAAAEAARDAGLGAPRAPVAGWPHASERVGVSMGCGIGGLGDVAAAAELLGGGEGDGHRRLSPFFVPRILANMAAGHVGIAWGLRGPSLCASTACASGAHALGDAFRAIKYGSADAMLAGGAEACVHPLAMAGFSRARALSTRCNEDPARASRPFDAARDGFVLGEGAGVLMLEERGAARARGARIYAEIRGYGASADAFHITSPAEDGSGAVRSMRAAMLEAGVEAADVAYINAHATGTPTGDTIEARAIDEVLSGGGLGALVSSTKGALGHLLGAAGAVEAVLSVMALHTVREGGWGRGGRSCACCHPYHSSTHPTHTLHLQGMAPPSVNLTHPDYAPANFRFAPEVPTELAAGRDAVLSNSFGFGGTCCSLVFGRDDGRGGEA